MSIIVEHVSQDKIVKCWLSWSLAASIGSFEGVWFHLKNYIFSWSNYSKKAKKHFVFFCKWKKWVYAIATL